MQADGNFVVYDFQNEALWSSYTQNNPGSTVQIQDDGNLVIYSSSHNPIWSTQKLGSECTGMSTH